MIVTVCADGMSINLDVRVIPHPQYYYCRLTEVRWESEKGEPKLIMTLSGDKSDPISLELAMEAFLAGRSDGMEYIASRNEKEMQRLTTSCQIWGVIWGTFFVTLGYFISRYFVGA